MDDKVTPFPEARKTKGRRKRATVVSESKLHVLQPVIGMTAKRMLHEAQDADLAEAVVVGWMVTGTSTAARPSAMARTSSGCYTSLSATCSPAAISSRRPARAGGQPLTSSRLPINCARPRT